MLIKERGQIDKTTVGCIFTFENKYLLLHRTRDEYWNSVSGKVELIDNNPEDAIKREISEELSIHVIPKKLTITHHKYGKDVIEYHLFYHNLTEEEYSSITFNSEHDKKGLFDLSQALKLNLYEDEDYCLKLHNKTINKKT